MDIKKERKEETRKRKPYIKKERNYPELPVSEFDAVIDSKTITLVTLERAAEIFELPHRIFKMRYITNLNKIYNMEIYHLWNHYFIEKQSLLEAQTMIKEHKALHQKLWRKYANN